MYCIGIFQQNQCLDIKKQHTYIRMGPYTQRAHALRRH